MVENTCKTVDDYIGMMEEPEAREEKFVVEWKPTKEEEAELTAEVREEKMRELNNEYEITEEE